MGLLGGIIKKIEDAGKKKKDFMTVRIWLIEVIVYLK